MTSPRTPSYARTFREAARRIAEDECDFISHDPGPRGVAALGSVRDHTRLERMIGEQLFFDDGEGFYPTPESRHERVVFLCFAAAVEANP